MNKPIIDPTKQQEQIVVRGQAKYELAVPMMLVHREEFSNRSIRIEEIIEALQFVNRMERALTYIDLEKIPGDLQFIKQHADVFLYITRFLHDALIYNHDGLIDAAKHRNIPKYIVSGGQNNESNCE